MIVKVHAASVNPLDWHYMRGEPYFMRAMREWAGRKHSHGVDFAGTVESVGKNVTRFKPGDEVFGGRDGAFAQYVSVAEKGSLAMKPDNMTFEQAAAVPSPPSRLWQHCATRKPSSGAERLDQRRIRRRRHVCSADAKVYGAKVTGVCSTGT